MNETLVSKNGDEDYIANFYNCNHHNLPCLTIVQDKLFLCPFAAHVKHYFIKANKPVPITEQDYIKIEDINNDIDIL
jgi:hypothetical protein